MEKFFIAKDFVRQVRRFNAAARTVEFRIRRVPENEDPVNWVREAVTQIILRATEDLLPSDRVGFTFSSKQFQRGEGWVPFQEASKVTVEDVWAVLNGIFQSNSSGLDTDTFCLNVTSVRMPVGSGKGKHYNTFEEECRSRRGIIVINNDNNLCLPIALVVAIAYATKDRNYNKIRRSKRKTLQTDMARKLMCEAGVAIPEDGAGISEIEKFQRHLAPNFKITVYRYGSKGRDVLFEGPEAANKINLLFHKNHFNVIVSLTAAFVCRFYCDDCHVPYDHKNEHRCSKSCSSCQQSPPCLAEAKVKCLECLRSFKSQNCYEKHKNPNSYDKNNSVCAALKLCRNCLKLHKSNREHQCGEVFCKTCNKHELEGHLCYMQPDVKSPKTQDTLFVFYDLETRQEKIVEGVGYEHEVNLCVFKQCCDRCISTENERCDTCGKRLQKLKGDTAIPDFLSHLLTIRKKFKNVIVLAHNGQAFDHQFILNHIMVNTDLTPELIMRGTKIILMQLENLKFLDSLNYFPMGLSKFPKAFGLGNNFKKGYFPHLFNTRANEHYVGKLPDVEYYSADSMMENERNAFLAWYEEHKNEEFNFQKELEEYCVSDVEILTEACLKFRQLMISSSNVCPFSEACTIASACNKVYRRNFLKPNTIGIIPKGGYRHADNQSKIAIQWLLWEERVRGINIKHAAKTREVKLNGHKVDGYCEETNQVFEFHGCYYHGHPECLKYNRDKALHDNPTETLNQRYESTMAKTERFRAFGYQVIEKWECHFRKEMAENIGIKEMVKTHPILNNTPLNPRDAFYGGRTGNCKTYYKAKKGEKIKYLDVCSLYPWVNKYGVYPVGHPQVVVGEDCKNLNLQETNGLIKCKILPPRDLYHPVLPSKMNGKLMFVLCKSCGENQSYDECNHNEEERALTGTWVIAEVTKAIEKGYKILHITEVWKYEVVKYNPDTKSGGLFVEMMNKFIKTKTEASGWPSDCTTDEKKKNYIENFLKQEGIELDSNNITSNPGLRSLAKLMLNSFWGKLGQQERQPKTKIITSPDEFFTLLNNPAIDVNTVLPINETSLLVNYEFKEESYVPLPTVNVALAAFTTAQARLKLYSYLEKLQTKILYYDTDSVIFIQKDDEEGLPTGEFIGDLTDELECYGLGSYILEFACGGPKNYAYVLYSTKEQKEKVVCKVKGIRLDYDASRYINFQSIRDMILKGEASEPIPITSRVIRTTGFHEIVTREQTKAYKVKSTKRKFFADYNSVPYGFVKKLKITEY